MARALDQFVSSGDEISDSEEALLKWRQAIRDQVEEDLEYQVRLRLQIHRPLHDYFKQHPTVIQPQLLELKKRTVVSLENQKQSKEYNSPFHHDVEQLNDELEQTHFEDKEVIIGSATTFTKTKCELETVAGSKNICEQKDNSDSEGQQCKTEGQNKTENQKKTYFEMSGADDADEIELSGVFDYVNVKYGTPKTQLTNLLENGCYKTVLVDSSGAGCGPNIKCPVEARVCLPTPSHKICEQPNPLNKSSIVAAMGVFSPVSEVRQASSHRTQPKLVYVSGKETKTGPTESLQFESRFESGNLHQVFQLTSWEYVLLLSPDLYSKRHTQWFYFQVEGMVNKGSYTFHIANFYKPDSLYNYGMQPLLYSEASAKHSVSGWTRVGHHISYHKTKVEHTHPEILEKGNLYTLTWTMEFPSDDDTCYLAHCFPYSYSQLLLYLSKFKDCPHLSRETLCNTLAGNPCPLLTITDFNEPEEKPRMGVVITARVHPGETNSSWIMQGLLDFLTSECTHAKHLRTQYVFKLAPMLNPDGVIVGNYRTSLSGVDLNRVYKSPQADLFPTIHHVKGMIKEFMKERKLLLYVDLHGHSRKQNVFMYGCHVPHCEHFQLLQERVLPFLLSQQAPQMFDFGSCKFCVEKCKEATGRVVTWRMGVPNAYTMEASFCGSNSADTKRHFTTEDLLCLGRKLAEAIHYYHRYIESTSYRVKVHSQIAEVILKSKSDFKTTRNQLLPQITGSITGSIEPSSKKRHYNRRVLNKFMRTNIKVLEQESSTSGSDSEDDDFSWKTKQARRRKTTTKLPKMKPSQSQSMIRDAVPPKAHRKLLPSTGSSYSAPARMLPNVDTSASKSTLPSTWKFVSKYQNRSNGGIPIFSEERLQERKEKKLQSESWIHSSYTHEPEAHFKHKTELWAPHGIPSWPRRLEPIKDSEMHYRHITDAHEHHGDAHEHHGDERIRLRENIMHLKLSPQLAKYISETWKS